ncbi:hypothetical protein HNY73_018989 [Argiope bruennichi]|uniref:Uncharacterized protein n=1 Tax=Argiope bruennichi TaxID=94029 RepID=A0A8T0EFF2_ARGBR|nr:hypothetical protein HNY73_018989 [Argiope bruennichi]
MLARHHLSTYDRGRAVGRLEAGQSVTTVVSSMGVSKSVISGLKKAAEGGNALQKHAGGRGRNTTSLEDRYVTLVAKRKFNSWSNNCKPCNRYRYECGHWWSKDRICMELMIGYSVIILDVPKLVDRH